MRVPNSVQVRRLPSIRLLCSSIPAADQGSSVHEDANGRTVVSVRAPDMYRIVGSSTVGDHILTVTASAPGLEAYAFTFG